MLEIRALGYKDDRAAVTFIAKSKKGSLILLNLFESFIIDHFGKEINIVDVADQIPLNVEVTAIFEGSGKFGWTWEHPKNKHQYEIL